MTYLEPAVMGLLQGLTEFLPVSSSGHLGLAKAMFGVREPALAFDLTLHVATTCAVLLYFRRDIASLLRDWAGGFFRAGARSEPGWRFGWAVIVAVLVTGPIGILLKSVSETASLSLRLLSLGFFASAGLLYSTRYLAARDGLVKPLNGLFTGLAQGIAVMPGLSRSGATIWSGLIQGLSREEAFRFSFLLSVPTILGATLLEALELGGVDEFFAALPDGWFLGALIAGVAGFLSLSLLRKLVTGDKMWIFAVYCLVVGFITIILSFTGA